MPNVRIPNPFDIGTIVRVQLFRAVDCISLSVNDIAGARRSFCAYCVPSVIGLLHEIVFVRRHFIRPPLGQAWNRSCRPDCPRSVDL